MGKRSSAATQRRPVSSRKDTSDTKHQVIGVKDLIRWPVRLFLDPKQFWSLAGLLLVAEVVVNVFVIQKVSCKYL